MYWKSQRQVFRSNTHIRQCLRGLYTYFDNDRLSSLSLTHTRRSNRQGISINRFVQSMNTESELDHEIRFIELPRSVYPILSPKGYSGVGGVATRQPYSSVLMIHFYIDIYSKPPPAHHNPRYFCTITDSIFNGSSAGAAVLGRDIRDRYAHRPE